MGDDLYHCCRWCKWFQKDKCTNEAFSIVQVTIDSFYEDGVLSEAVKEGFGAETFNELKTALSESSISKKKQKEILKVFFSELEDTIVNWTEEIDCQVSKALNAFDFNTENGITIRDPHSFYCKNFWRKENAQDDDN